MSSNDFTVKSLQKHVVNGINEATVTFNLDDLSSLTDLVGIPEVVYLSDCWSVVTDDQLRDLAGDIDAGILEDCLSKCNTSLDAVYQEANLLVSYAIDNILFTISEEINSVLSDYLNQGLVDGATINPLSHLDLAMLSTKADSEGKSLTLSSDSIFTSAYVVSCASSIRVVFNLEM